VSNDKVPMIEFLDNLFVKERSTLLAQIKEIDKALSIQRQLGDKP
jgi:hypothetical protein